MQRVEHVLAQLWPHCRAMDPHCAGVASGEDDQAGLPSCTAIVFAIMRHAIRFSTFVQTMRAGTSQRFLYLSCACAQRILHEVNGTACGWLAAARARWTEVAGVDTPCERGVSDVMNRYLAAACESEAWLVDPISFSKMHIQDACIRVQTEHLAFVVARYTSRRITSRRTFSQAAEAPGTRAVW